jgi:DNA repair ATPase RecN
MTSSGLSEGLLISALNHIEKIQSKFTKIPKIKDSIEDELSTVAEDIKLYMRTLGDQQVQIEYLNDRVKQLEAEKEKLVLKHREAIENLEMLMFQEDYADLRHKIHQFKLKPLDESEVSFFTPALS